MRALPLPRFLRAWYFNGACRRQLRRAGHDATVGFDKIAGLDVHYPQGGVYAASVDFNLLKHRWALTRRVLRTLKWLDPAHLSSLALERVQFHGGRALVVAISDMVRRHMEDRYGIDPANLRVLPIAPPPDRFDECDRPRRRYEARRRWGLGPDRVIALFAGMNYRLKGLEPLLHALHRLKEGPDLVVVGQPKTTAFERRARRLGIADRVRFAGYCPDMRDAYFAADLLVHPTFYDPCSNVVLEAMACGLPVITTRNNGASEMLRPAGARRRVRRGAGAGRPARPRPSGVVSGADDESRAAGRLRQGGAAQCGGVDLRASLPGDAGDPGRGGGAKREAA